LSGEEDGAPPDSETGDWLQIASCVHFALGYPAIMVPSA
jgi:hypothetical protein